MFAVAVAVVPELLGPLPLLPPAAAHAECRGRTALGASEGILSPLHSSVSAAHGEEARGSCADRDATPSGCSTTCGLSLIHI